MKINGKKKMTVLLTYCELRFLEKDRVDRDTLDPFHMSMEAPTTAIRYDGGA